jgi:hypothetical protein
MPERMPKVEMSTGRYSYGPDEYVMTPNDEESIPFYVAGRISTMNTPVLDMVTVVATSASSAEQVIDYLRRFNSKERFFLVGHILGNPQFVPSDKFVQEIEHSLKIELPSEPFAAMDYHLDWLYASLYLAFQNGSSKIHPNDDAIIKGQQEDVDFLLAFIDVQKQCHIVLVEAKGVTSWTNKQMRSKILRLGRIFGLDGKKWPGIVPHFVILSPGRPQHLDTSQWPNWISADGKVPWARLPTPSELYKVTRCDEHGRPNRQDRWWKMEPR